MDTVEQIRRPISKDEKRSLESTLKRCLKQNEADPEPTGFFGKLADRMTQRPLFRQSRKSQIERCQTMLTAGKLDVIVCKSSVAVHITQVEDEGDTFLFWGAPKTILCLSGQDIYPSPKFPNDHFEIILDPGGTFYDLSLLGRKIPDVSVISGTKSPGVLPDTVTIF